MLWCGLGCKFKKLLGIHSSVGFLIPCDINPTLPAHSASQCNEAQGSVRGVMYFHLLSWARSQRTLGDGFLSSCSGYEKFII